MDTDNILKIVEKQRENHGGLISILQEIQAKYTYLPQDALRTVANETNHSLVDIYGVATFYKSFSLKPRGKHLVSVCLGTACHVRGGPIIAEEFKRQLGIGAGETTPDNGFSLETVNCLGACALGPIVVVDGYYFSNVHVSKVGPILQDARNGRDKIQVAGDKRIFPVSVSCPRCNHGLMDPSHTIDGYPSIKVTVAFEHKHGWLRLSCLYGSYVVESEYQIPMDTVVNFFCPHCHAELRGAVDCVQCGAPMVPMIVSGGGMVQICSRRGCNAHMLDVNGIIS